MKKRDLFFSPSLSFLSFLRVHYFYCLKPRAAFLFGLGLGFLCQLKGTKKGEKEQRNTPSIQGNEAAATGAAAAATVEEEAAPPTEAQAAAEASEGSLPPMSLIRDS